MPLFRTAAIEVLKMVKPLSTTTAIEFKYGEAAVPNSGICQVVAHVV